MANRFVLMSAAGLVCLSVPSFAQQTPQAPASLSSTGSASSGVDMVEPIEPTQFVEPQASAGAPDVGGTAPGTVGQGAQTRIGVDGEPGAPRARQRAAGTGEAGPQDPSVLSSTAAAAIAVDEFDD